MASISQRGASWRATIRRKGVSLSRTFDNREQAETWADREERRIDAGLTKQQIVRTPAGTSVADLFDRYAREVSPSKDGHRWEVIRLAALGKAFSGPAAGLDGGALAEWRDKRLAEVSAATVNRELNLISAVLTRAIKEWRLPMAVNPVSMIQRPRQPANRKRRVPEDERAAVIKELGWSGEAAPDDLREWIAWGFCLALETMMRQGEILRMTWQHVHLDRRHVHLPKTKNGESRNVPLSSRALALFRMLPEGKGSQRVVPVSAGTFGAYFREAVRNAGLEDLHFHDTRREALTTLAPKFGNPMDLGKASGHRDMRSLRVYYEPDVESLADKLD